MRFSRAWAVCLTLFVIAAAALASPAHAQSQSTGQPRVYLLRGLANIFSLGMDDLAAKLNARGIKASVHSYADLEVLSRYAIEQASTGKRPTPVVIIGHSLGADAAVYMGNRLAGAGVPVPLVVTFDPVTPTVASAKIGKVVNYYQAGGSGRPVSGPRVDNIDLTTSGQLSHFNIEKAAELHSRVIAMIQRPVPTRPVATRPKPKAVAPAASAAPVETPAATPASTPAGTVAPASSTSSSAAPTAAGTETASVPSTAVTAPAGMGTSN